jgi:hypothetical protein
MSQLSTMTASQDRQAQWRERIARQAASGKSVAAFCRDEAIATQTFYWWRARLGKRDAHTAPRAKAKAAPFIDLGTMGEADVDAMPGIDIRLDLGHGITLTIARR